MCTVCGAQAWIFVSSYHSHSLAPVSPEGKVTLLAGCGAPKRADGVGAEAAFHAPNGLAIDAAGNLYVADSGNHCLRRVTPDGRVSTMAGTGTPSLSPHALNSPCGVAICTLRGRGPVLLVADRSNCCVRALETDAVPPPCLAPSTIRRDLRALLDAEQWAYAQVCAIVCDEHACAQGVPPGT